MVAAQQTQRSWLSAAKRRDQTIGSITYDKGAGGPRRQNLRNAGYLERLRCYVTLTGPYVTAGPTGVDSYGQYCGPVQRVTVEANSVAPLFDCEGMAWAMVSMIDRQYRYGTTISLPSAIAPGSFTAAPALAAFTNAWIMDVPISLDLVNKPYPYGLFQTALNAQEITVAVRFTPATGVAGSPGSAVYIGTAANLTTDVGAVAIQQCYFDPIPEPAAQPYLGMVHQWRSWRVPLTGDGTMEIELPPSNIYLRLIFVVSGGATVALAPTFLQRLRLVYGTNLTPYDEGVNQVLGRQAAYYGAALPGGVYVLDLLEETHVERDVVNGAATTDLRALLDFAGGTYGAGSHVLVIAEQLIPISVGGAGAVGVQG
jgi:hypothetical protein